MIMIIIKIMKMVTVMVMRMIMGMKMREPHRSAATPPRG